MSDNKHTAVKIIYRPLILAILSLTGFGCEKSENINSNPCAQGKLIQQWCPDPSDLAIVQIHSNTNVGENWTKNGKTYQNVVLAQINKKLLDSSDWDVIIESSDSTFYFNYSTVESQDVSMCYICCPPATTILINSISLSPCPITTDK